eukprot:Hpha_TRINITY_DN8270_c0_g1::TRINITY_DN8270_c0_g1_i1::g.111782::m.111782/K04515/CAMK2; calcium/calmodulin-dependent protein kinase (CaM kinase) II
MEELQRKYSVREQLGKGSYATVYKVVERTSGDEFAAKVMDKIRLGEKGVGQVRQETEILSSLSHSNIIKLLGIIEDTEHIIIILELLSGELFKRIARLRHYSERTACVLMRNFLRVLEYMHGQGIVHRDLKPDNLLLKETEDEKRLGDQEVTRIKVADFGFATSFSAHPHQVQACGTPYYIAPELLETGVFKTQSYYVPPPCDIWSTGVIMYVLLSGYPPFRVARDVPDAKGKLFRQIRKGRVVFDKGQAWDRISPEAKDLIEKMLVTNPDQRITATQALAHGWFTKQGINDDHLQESVEEMQDFDARTKMKGAVFGVEAAFRLIYSGACDKINRGKKNSSLLDTLAATTESLAEIDLTNNYLGPKGFDALVSVINKHESITTLKLRNSLIDTEQCIKLCKVLQDPRSVSRINSIDLSLNPLTHPAGRALLAMLQARRRVTVINLEGTYISQTLVKKITDQAARNVDMPSGHGPGARTGPGTASTTSVAPARTGSAAPRGGPPREPRTGPPPRAAPGGKSPPGARKVP